MPLNRKQRLAMKRDDVSAEAIKRLLGGKNLESAVSTSIYLTPEFIHAAPFSRHLRGEISERQLFEAIADMMADPEFFFERWFVVDGRENPLRDYVANNGARLLETVAKQRDAYAHYRTARKELVLARRRIYDDRRKSALPAEVLAELDKTYPMGKIPPAEFDFNSILERVPNVRFHYLICYFKHHLSDNGHKQNDIVDLMHVFYTPDVDLMRCDKAIFQALRGCPYIETEKFVRTLEELPERIERLLNPSESAPLVS